MEQTPRGSSGFKSPRGAVAFPGGKRKLLPAIFGLTAAALPRSQWPETTFADPFLGGGVVSLAAKRLGFRRVLANDRAARSAVLGRAVVANSVHLSARTALRLYADPPIVAGPVPSIVSRVPSPSAAFLERAWRHLHGGSFEGVRSDLVATLLLKWLTRSLPMSLPGSDGPAIAARDYDRITPVRVAGYMRASARLTTPTAVMKLAAELNDLLVPGDASVSQLDAFDFLRGIDADVVYLDAPYGGTQGYERAFALIDEFFGYEQLPTSAFSSRRPPLDELLEACADIPVAVLSMNNAVFDEPSLTELVGRHRVVERVLSVPYRHYGALATAQKNATNRELLLLATRR